MRLATWNVNSLKVRLPHLLQWVPQAAPDIVCLQETKQEDKAFPVEAIEAAGYRVAFAGQKTYNGVAILSRGALSDVIDGLPEFPDPQKRFLAATAETDSGPVRVVCAYIPNGQAVDSDKYAYKLAWLDALARQIEGELARHPDLILAGDYNIAPEDRDVHDPVAWAGQILCSERERAAFRRLVAIGLEDTFRRFEQPEKSFSWWDYRMAGYRRNLGLRIDHILASHRLAARCTACTIDREPRGWERPSDHAPVVADFAATTDA